MRGFGYSQMYYQPSFWPQGFIALLINVLIWGLIIYLVVLLVRKIAGHGHTGCCGMGQGHERRDDSYYLNITKERYSKGEIDKRQYEELKHEFSEGLKEIAEEKTKE